ncbi:hypothetical protein KL86PLE_100071 [uncultured Pleomorphomonas sp.]|uniref:Uncharacterized protein n=1 Tax=uncultured Pleomorphomonas sp. TaxID=442121 RepID=A0A212L184_9HYPH|nr:hypothetical protein KL86PLE_100071 [uncultured Pleomorphomonas sp.]
MPTEISSGHRTKSIAIRDRCGRIPKGVDPHDNCRRVTPGEPRRQAQRHGPYLQGG